MRDMDLRGRLVSYKGRVGMITCICRDGLTVHVTFVNDGEGGQRVAYHVPRKVFA